MVSCLDFLASQSFKGLGADHHFTLSGILGSFEFLSFPRKILVEFLAKSSPSTNSKDVCLTLVLVFGFSRLDFVEELPRGFGHSFLKRKQC